MTYKWLAVQMAVFTSAGRWLAVLLDFVNESDTTDFSIARAVKYIVMVILSKSKAYSDKGNPIRQISKD